MGGGLPLRVLFLGTPDFAVPTLHSLLASRHGVAGVLTRRDRPAGRGAHPLPAPVKTAALAAGLPLLQPARVNSEPTYAAIRALAPDVAVVVAFGCLLSPEFLVLPPRGCINVHASLLPAYRGAAPIARAIMAGEVRTGVTTMRMERGLDTGDILLSRACEIGTLETAGELTSRLADLGAGLLLETIEAQARDALRPTPQDATQATVAPSLTRQDGVIDWNDSAQAVACRVRGCNPWPLATAGLRGKRVQILRAAEIAAAQGPGAGRDHGGGVPSPPGRVVEADKGRVIVVCGEGSRLSLLELCFPGGRAIRALDALNGRLVLHDDHFTSPPA